MNFRVAALDDIPLLAEWNAQLIHDEGHRNPMTVAELEARMRGWLVWEYRAILFDKPTGPVAYALYREGDDEIYLRQFFVRREARRTGIGSECIALLRDWIWPRHKRVTVGALIGNKAAIAFWRAVGFADYSLTFEMPPRSHPAQ